MRIEIDLSDPFGWFVSNYPWSLAAVLAAWYVPAAAVLRVAYWKRPGWFGRDGEAYASLRRANLTLALCVSPFAVAFVPPVVAVWTALWAVTLGIIPLPFGGKK
jgi:hypothetical protein